MKLAGLVVLVLLNWDFARGDLPVNCTMDDVLGSWVIYEGPVSDAPDLDCSSLPIVKRKIRIELGEGFAYYNGSPEGFWTMIYNEGFEMNLHYRTYFSFFKYEQRENGPVISLCNETIVGKSHDVTLRHWACFYGRKVDSAPLQGGPKMHKYPFESGLLEERVPSDGEHRAVVDAVNQKQSRWRAKVHEDFLGRSSDYLLNLRGGKRSWLPRRARPAEVSNSSIASERERNEGLDWRNVNGVNYLSPVRNQGSCGSCYAFSSVGMIEARLRVMTGNELQPVLSPQDIVSCTNLSQGCEGGFPYLIAGKYGWERGLVDESCYPYAGHDQSCRIEKCHRWYTASYEYVGGYYGACSERKMMEALENGPLSVSFEVYPDFMHYKTGIYHYTGVEAFKPFVIVNHAVLLVGYGVEESSGEKFWIVKNSWGEDWGEDGYFRIRRGVDECGIESIAVQAFPIPY